MAQFNPKWKKIARYLGIDVILGRLNNGLNRQKALIQKVERLERVLDELALASQGPDRGTQIQLALQYRQLLKEGTVLPFSEVEFRNYSQFGEDGILHYIFSLVGTTNKYAAEFCAGIGSECNTANLILHHGWHALLVDGDEKKVEQGKQFFRSHPDSQFSPPTFLQRWIDRDSINSILQDNGFSGEIDLLSLDMDGVDYWIWDAISVISPRVVVVEVNLHMGHEPVTVPYRADFSTQWIVVDPPAPQANSEGEVRPRKAMYGGASLAAFNKLAQEKGYRLIGSNRFHSNVFFMRNDVGSEVFVERPLSDCSVAELPPDVQRAATALQERELVRV